MNAASKRILVVVTSHREWSEAGRETGYWAGEVSHFCEVLREEGYDFDMVSPLGGPAPIDQKSVSGYQSWDGGYAALLRDPALKEKLENTLRPEDVRPEDYAAIYYVGGHGTMWDFPGNEKLAEVAARLYEQGRPVAAVCHGVTGLLNIKLSTGEYLLQGKPVTGFANIEERLMGLSSKVPFLTEDEMKKRGALYRRGLPFTAHVEVGERLVTGQNPRSSKRVAQELVKLLKRA
ncbi:MAG TPA: type 1 glutamine amidotransferase domain-containing protein [Archangium sp.]|uniref:type 1 glutamine amidotransferase domain-containing protein n=1 Tax=Archangium sp. TaxID=1872627 RepID=UPI002ED90F8E